MAESSLAEVAEDGIVCEGVAGGVFGGLGWWC